MIWTSKGAKVVDAQAQLKGASKGRVSVQESKLIQCHRQKASAG